jgi:flagellar biosynthesis/type III secretory pathway M-ring protein FliF/YscJ
MSFFWIIPAFILFVILLAILYWTVMIRPRTPEERAESPDQMRTGKSAAREEADRSAMRSARPTG